MLEPLRLGLRDLPPELRELVIAASTIGLTGSGTTPDLGDQAVGKQPFDQAVQSAGAEPHSSIRSCLDVLENLVAVAAALSERGEQLEGGLGERKMIAGIACHTASDDMSRHAICQARLP